MDLIKIKNTNCAKCFSISYALPCQIDVSIVDYFKAFGVPIYPLKSIKLLKIESGNGFNIESRLGSKVIKFSMPVRYKNKNSRQIEFENRLAEWMEVKLDIKID